MRIIGHARGGGTPYISDTGCATVMGSVFTRMMGYVSLGCNFMGYTFGYFGILGCDFGRKMLDGVYVWPKMVVHGA